MWILAALLTLVAAQENAVPTSWDWRMHGAVTPVTNEGQVCCIVAFASPFKAR